MKVNLPEVRVQVCLDWACDLSSIKIDIAFPIFQLLVQYRAITSHSFSATYVQTYLTQKHGTCFITPLIHDFIEIYQFTCESFRSRIYGQLNYLNVIEIANNHNCRNTEYPKYMLCLSTYLPFRFVFNSLSNLLAKVWVRKISVGNYFQS